MSWNYRDRDDRNIDYHLRTRNYPAHHNKWYYIWTNPIRSICPESWFETEQVIERPMYRENYYSRGPSRNVYIVGHRNGAVRPY